MDETNKYYYNGENGGVGTVTNTREDGKGEPNATFDTLTGTLTLHGLTLTVSSDFAIEANNTNLTMNLEGENSITQTGNTCAISITKDLTISGAGKLTVRDSSASGRSLIFANGKLEIKDGAVIDAAKTGGEAQPIRVVGAVTITGTNTSVKAVNNGNTTGSHAIQVYDSNGNNTVTVSDGATLEAETRSKTAKAINGNVDISNADELQITVGANAASSNSWDKKTPLNKYPYVKITSETATTPPTPPTPPTEKYLTFTAQEAKSMISLKWKSADPNSVYIRKNDGTTWDSYTAGETITLMNVGDKVSFKGMKVKTGADKHFTMTGKIAASGSVTSLTDGKGNDPNVPSEDLYYFGMFKGCDSLTTAPELPAVNLAKQCYAYMFYGCTNLTTVPELPATVLAESCYADMFNLCKRLETAPALPAIEAKKSCYKNMFYDCKSLTTAPDLPATKLANNCYDLMFYGCSALQAAPTLPATNLADYCYYGMFTGCTKLTMPPSTLPAESLKYWCYNGMFRGCTSLKTVPTISATSLATECFKEMFKDCSNLSISQTKDTQHTEEWIIKATEPTNVSSWNKDMFAGCTHVDFGSDSKEPQLKTTYYVNPSGANSGGTTTTGTTITKPTLAENTFSYQGQNITPTLKFTNPDDKNHVTISGDRSKRDVNDNNNYTITVTPHAGYTWEDDKTTDTVFLRWGITRAGNIHVNVGNMTAYVDDTTLPQHKYTITGLLGEDQNQASVIFAYHRIIDAAGNAEQKESVPDLTREGKYRIDVLKLTIAEADYTQNYTSWNYTSGELEIVKKDSTPSGSSGGGYVAPSTDVKTSGSADSKVTSSPSTVQNETRTDASGKQETVAKVTVSAANQREILSQAKANKSKHIIIQIAKTAVQGDAKLELNLDKTFVQSILHDTEASLTIRTAYGDRVISREALKTLVAQTEGNTVVIDPAAQENPTDPAEPSKAETLAALDSSRLVARSKLVTLKNGRKGIRITWSDRNGAEMNFDGMEIYRSTKKNRFGKKPFYATKGGKSAGYYINSKGIRSGVTYYYKVRGYVLIDGQKHYTDLSLKAIRTVK